MATDGGEVFLMNRRGQKETLFTLPREFTAFKGASDGGSRISEPRPLMPRKRERILADRTDLTSKTGEFYLENVMISRSMDGVKPGTITVE